MPRSRFIFYFCITRNSLTPKAIRRMGSNFKQRFLEPRRQGFSLKKWVGKVLGTRLDFWDRLDGKSCRMIG